MAATGNADQRDDSHLRDGNHKPVQLCSWINHLKVIVEHRVFFGDTSVIAVSLVQ